MNTRERFLEVCDFNPAVSALKWEFGYWGETIKNWYSQGLPQHRYPPLPSEITTPASSLYIPAWTCRHDGVLPNGIAVMAGALYWPTQGFPRRYRRPRSFRHGPATPPRGREPAAGADVRGGVLRGDRAVVEVPRHRRREADLLERGSHDPHGLRVADRRLAKLGAAQGPAAQRQEHRQPLPQELAGAGKRIPPARLPPGHRRLSNGLLRHPGPPAGLREPVCLVSPTTGLDPRHPQHLHRHLDRRLCGSAGPGRDRRLGDMGGHVGQERLDDLAADDARVLCCPT